MSNTDEEGPSALPSLSKGSQECFETECEPCGENGNIVKAEGYCVTCKEFMCQNCIMCHRSMKVSRKHKIQGPDEMPKDKPSDDDDNASYTTHDMPTKLCISHKNEVIKYFCKDHKTVCCVDCVTLSHRSCTNIVLVNEVCNDDTTSAELRKFFQRMNDISDGIKGLLDTAENNRIIIEEQREKLLRSVRIFRESIIETINKFVKAIEMKIEAKTKENQEKTDQVTECCNTIQKHIEVMSNQFEILQNNNQKCEEFILMNQSENQLDEWERNKQEMTTKTHLRRNVFCPSLKIRRPLLEIKEIGDLVEETGAELCEACEIMTLKTNVQSLSCGHFYCDICIPVVTDNKRTCPSCGTVTELCEACENMTLKTNVQSLSCGHFCCDVCIPVATDNKRTCPLCRTVTVKCRKCQTAVGLSSISALACGHGCCQTCIKGMIKNKSPCTDCGLVTVQCKRCQNAVDQTSISSLACGHEVCLSCRKQQTENEAPCTDCGMITGNQPDGSLSVEDSNMLIRLQFEVPDGNQKNYHPCPGKAYTGQTLTYRLKNDEKGRKISQMFRTAFDRKLVCKIDQDRVTPNIELFTGPVCSGYTLLYSQPYNDFIDRVTKRLNKLGIEN